MSELLQVEGFTIQDARGNRLVGPIGLSLREGEVAALVGRSGSGKSLFARGLVGCLQTGLKAQGRVVLGGVEVADSRLFWGRELFLVPQQAGQALNSLCYVKDQIQEVYTWVRKSPDRTDEILEKVDLSPAEMVSRYPYELSGGMKQRVLAAIAMAVPAKVILFDEPTKGLDPERKRDLLRLLKTLKEAGKALLLITHDPVILDDLAETVIVLRDGQVLEQGRLKEIWESPQDPFTQTYLKAARDPLPRPKAGGCDRGPVLETRNLAFSYNPGTELLTGIDLKVFPGEIVGLTGPSGRGKSTLGSLALGLLRPQSGQILWQGESIWQKSKRWRTTQRNRYLKIYQDPTESFLPHLAIGTFLNDLLKLLTNSPERKAVPSLERLLEHLELSPEVLGRLPHQLSGGELQRLALVQVALARPRFILADEPTSQLDPLASRRTASFLQDLARREGTGILFIGHREGLVEQISDRVERL